MVAAFDKAHVKVEVKNILIRRGVPEKNTPKVVPIKFTAAVARAFDVDM
jgi:hypothetical protein